jgi:Tfp pilus assembly protein PilN
MTTAVKEKKPFLPTRKPAATPTDAVVRAGGAARVGAGSNAVSLGGEPRVHLLPLEVVERKKVRTLKRRLFIAVIAVVVVVAAGYGLATVTLATTQSQLSDAQSATAGLLTQQAKYDEVTKVKADIAAIQAAQKTGTAQEILWDPYVSKIEATLPAGATIMTVASKIDAPFAAASTDQSVPLQGPHVATITLSLSMVQGTVPAWLNSLPSLPGYVDSTLDSATNTDAGVYSVVVTVHVSDSAYSKRFSTTTGDTK